MSEPSIYAKAIEVIREKGWAHSPYDNGVCLVQALGDSEAADELSQATGCYPVWEWNDVPKRTVEDVLLLLKYADAGELDTWRKLYGPGSGGEA